MSVIPLSAQAKTFSQRLFNETFYLSNNPDVLQAVSLGLTTAFEHFSTFGHRENRPLLPFFDTQAYLLANPDVLNATTDPGWVSAWNHFVLFGILEGRSPNGTTGFTGLFDNTKYLAQNPDVNTAVSGGDFRNGFEHYLLFGAKEGRAAFDNGGNAIDFASSVTPGKTFTLTTSVDLLTGTSGNDTFLAAIVGNNGTGSTLNPGDNLKGGIGTDTLQLNISGSRGSNNGDSATTSAFTLSGIERVLVSNFATDGNNTGKNTLDMATATGLKVLALTSSGAGGNTEFINVQNVVDAEMRNGDKDLTIHYATAVDLSGNNDIQKLTVSAQTSGKFTVDEGFETLEITSTGSKNTLTLAAGNKHKTIVVKGDKALTLDISDTNNTVETVDASAFTGDLTLSGLGATDINIKGGSGNDTVTVANLTAADTIDGGAGTNTLKTNAAITAANATNISNFQVLEVTGLVTQDVSAISGITGVVSSANGGGTVTFQNMGASTTLKITNGSNATNIIASLKTNTSSDSINVTIGKTSSGVTVNNLTLNDYETINIASTGGGSNKINASLASSSATKLVVTGNRDLEITNFTGSSNLKTIDASDFTGKLKMGAALPATNVTITGGSKDDTILGGTGNDSLTGGAGNDSIVSGGGNDTINAGDGNDTVVLAGGNVKVDLGAGDDIVTISYANLTSDDTIIGGDGTDTLRFASIANGDNIDLTGGNAAKISNVSGVEVISLDMSGINISGQSATLTVDDATVAAAGGTLTIKAVSAGNAGVTTIINANAVVLSSSQVVADLSNITNKMQYTVGNGKDQVTGSAQNDTFIVATSAYLSANDTLDAGGGTDDTLRFTSTTNSTITTAQFTNVKGFEIIEVNTGGVGNYTFTLNDTIVSQNNSGGQLTVTRNSTDTGTLKVDGSAVTSSYTLKLTGAGGVDTLTGGAGNDTINGGAGADEVNLSAGGVDYVVVRLAQTDGGDVIKNFTLYGTGSSAAAGADVFVFGVGVSSGNNPHEIALTTGTFGAQLATNNAPTNAGEIVALVSGNYNEAAGGSLNFTTGQVNVITTVGYTDALAALTANGFANDEAGLLLFYNLSTQRAELRYVADTNSDATTLEEDYLIAVFDGVTLTGMASFHEGNFAVIGV